MIILHAGWLDAALNFWAESSSGVGIAADRKTLASEFGVAVAGSRTVRKAEAWLPSCDNGPITSSDSRDADRMASWPVTVLSLKMTQSIHILMACADKRVVRPGLLVGADLAYWGAALRFAAGLVMRGQFLPGLATDVEPPHACWQPVISGADVARMHALSLAMPPVARALVSKAGDAQPDTAAQIVLRGFLASVVDALARPEIAPRASADFDSVHDQWLYALSSKDGTIRNSSTAELKTLVSQIQQWQRPIQIAANAPFRLCFRLRNRNWIPIPGWSAIFCRPIAI